MVKIGSLFSGIGGIEIGFEEEGYSTEWFVENEPYAREILRKRYKNATIYGDIKKIDFKSVPKVDIITGGFPCQDISNAGKRAGIEGSRSSLWKYYLEAIRILQPKYALVENVSALLNRGLNVVLADLASIGYDAEWYCVPASAVGANHQRDRVFIIAYSKRVRQYYGKTQEKISKGDACKETGGNSTRQGNYEDVEDAISNRMYEGIGQGQYRRMQEKEQTNNIEQRSKAISDTSEEGLQGCDCKEGSFAGQGWWSTEPGLGRVANGVSNRVDRIKCLGNAVVPQVAQIFAKAIKEVEEND
ncbi:MAG: DNA (cytosine-5-)-methyltransferase [Nanoarchaeota archaeon]|nr:DNA (cytosine-5-)-methyltransferase [Nanoarchaeota archaeon]